MTCYYSISIQYLHRSEKNIAQFSLLSDAELFIRNTLIQNDERQFNYMYKLYEDDELLQSYGATYPSEVYCFKENVDCPYQVFFHEGENKILLACFFDIHDAECFIAWKCLNDSTRGLDHQWIIYKENILVKTLSTAMVLNQHHLQVEQQSQLAQFHPKPLHTKFIPPNFPPNSWELANEHHSEKDA